MTAAIDPALFRDTLSNFPTGVVIVTAMIDGAPVGMVVGSFTSVSLDPPTVAYLPTRTSSTYAKLRHATHFCVNVLSVEQEFLARQFASKTGDKFADVEWQLSADGSPRLAGAVAWIDCVHEETFESGDHDIVVGRVTSLESNSDRIPLLFFQGGYGGFRTRSRVVPFASDLRGQLQLADVARGPMERLADELGAEVFSWAVVDGDLVVMATVGGGAGPVAQVGRRMPMLPPYGAVFLSNDDPASGVQRWIRDLRVAPETLEQYESMLRIVQERGWSVTLAGPDHDATWQAVIPEILSRPPSPALDRRFAEMVAGLLPYHEPALLDPQGTYQVRSIAAPVRVEGEVVLALGLHELPAQLSGAELNQFADRLRQTADEVAGLVDTAS